MILSLSLWSGICSLPLRSKMHFSGIKVNWHLRSQQGVCGFNCTSAQAEVLLCGGLKSLLKPQVCECVCSWVCAQRLSNSSLCQRQLRVLPPRRPLAGITCPALSVPFLSLYANSFKRYLGLEEVSRGGKEEGGGKHLKSSRRGIHILSCSTTLPVSLCVDIFVFLPTSFHPSSLLTPIILTNTFL